MNHAVESALFTASQPSRNSVFIWLFCLVHKTCTYLARQNLIFDKKLASTQFLRLMLVAMQVLAM